MPSTIGVFDFPAYVVAIMAISGVVLFGLSYVMTLFELALPALISLGLGVVCVLIVLVTYWTTLGVWTADADEAWIVLTVLASGVTIGFSVYAAHKIIDTCLEIRSKEPHP